MSYMNIKNILSKLLPRQYLWLYADKLIPKNFGQFGEDAVIYNHLAWLGLDSNKPGAYIDIGAFHPTRGSNTFRFYKKGSRGIAIDVGVEKEAIWKTSRRRDKFINAALVPETYKEDCIKFNKSEKYGKATDHIEGSGVVSELGEDKVNVAALRPSVLEKIILNEEYWLSSPWRFINIDIEGLDQEVLLEFDLRKLIPDIIAIEHFLPKHTSNWDKISYLSSCVLVREMQNRGYCLQSICGPTLIFLRLQ